MTGKCISFSSIVSFPFLNSFFSPPQTPLSFRFTWASRRESKTSFLWGNLTIRFKSNSTTLLRRTSSLQTKRVRQNWQANAFESRSSSLIFLVFFYIFIFSVFFCFFYFLYQKSQLRNRNCLNFY